VTQAQDAVSAPVDPAVLRSVMAAYPTGVTIVTSSEGERLCGMAANSFTSVSLDPPIVLVCLQRGARTCDAAKSAGRFAVHLMAHDQVAAVRAFVGRDAPRFSVTPYDLDAHGTPILRDRLALLVCRLHRSDVVGDHDVLYGEVERCERAGERAPLLFHESALRMLPRLPALVPRGAPLLPGEHDDLDDPLVRVLAPPPLRP
jgi:flavin reductase (DIM6/NTAB) family NADH-FMN oxidoreductase RutF